MLKVAIFTDTLPGQPNPIGHYAFQLAKSLAEQQTRVFLLSSENQAVGLPENLPSTLEAYFPFRSWGMHELPMAAFFLSRISPDVIHVFQASRKHSFYSCYPYLTDCVDFHSRPAKIFSLFSLPAGKPPAAIGYPVLRSDAIITQTHDVKNRLVHLYPMTAAKTHLVPMTMAGWEEDKRSRPLPEESGTANGPLVVIPGTVSDLFDAEGTLLAIESSLIANPNLEFAFTGDWGDYPPYRRNSFWRRVFPKNISHRLHFLSMDERRQRVESPERPVYYWLSPLDALKADLLQKLQLAISGDGLPLLDSGSLSLIHPEWPSLQKEIHCGPTAADLLEQLNRHGTTPENTELLRRKLARLQEGALIDQPANAMNRLYYRMLAR